MATRFPVPETLVQTAEVVNTARGRLRPLRRTFDQSLIPMVMVDNDRAHTEANAAARLVFRMSLRELRQHRIDDFTAERERPALESAWEELCVRGAVSDRHRVTLKDGCGFDVSYSATTNALPGQHLIVFAPMTLSEDELAEMRPSSEPDFQAPLSVRQLEVLRLVAVGASAIEIADELSISHATARTHVKNILSRLGANNRAHAVALAMRHSLLHDYDPHENGHTLRARGLRVATTAGVTKTGTTDAAPEIATTAGVTKIATTAGVTKTATTGGAPKIAATTGGATRIATGTDGEQ
jgi:DNA-binding NarL/FixJ family response regulator